MSHETLIVAPGPTPRSVALPGGEAREVPAGWDLLPPGDAGLTRRVKAAGPTWTVKARRGRRVISLGVWAPAATIEAARGALEEERATPAYQRRLAAGRERRARDEERYVEDFEAAIRDFLAFHPRHAAVAGELASRVAAHATPVGSGTVARTRRIPIEERAAAAVIAWMRHQTTGYDEMQIPRQKGARREVRRALAARSRALLSSYRRGEAPPPGCPLRQALTHDAGPLV